MHFGTFQLMAEGIDEPLRALAARERHAVSSDAFRTLAVGDSIVQVERQNSHAH